MPRIAIDAQGEAALSVLSSSAAAPPSPSSSSSSSPASSSSLRPSCGQCDSSALSSYSSTYRELHSLHTSAVRVLMRDGDRWSAAQHSIWQTGRVLLVNKLPLPAHCALFVRTADKRASTTSAPAATHSNGEQTLSSRQSQSAVTQYWPAASARQRNMIAMVVCRCLSDAEWCARLHPLL